MNQPTSAQLAVLRTRLESMLRDTEERLHGNGQFGLSESLRDSTGELSPIDNHPADTATELYEREKDISLLELEELKLQRIEAALAAVDNGTYGSCAACGKPIPQERLEALPDCLYCVEHAPRQEISTSRPVEEQYLWPPFGRSSYDDHQSLSGFDGEDSWQIVESWGNADSPAMSENRDVADYNHVGIEAEENDGYVEAYESFIATDITGRHVSVVRNREYEVYLDSGEGDHGLETIETEQD